jgi:hypothetical protein
MKRRSLSLFTVIALLALAMIYSDAWAGQEAPSTIPPEEEGKYVIPVEFTNVPDKQAALGTPTWGLNGNDPGQVVFTLAKDGAGGPYPNNSTYDFDGELDALANMGDAYFFDLIADRAVLLVSFQDEPVGAAGKKVIYAENWGAPPRNFAKWVDRDLVFDNPTVDSLDGIEVWGPYDADDADCYSLAGDPNGVSVWIWDGATSSPYLLKTHIAAAVIEVGYTGSEQDVDVDALMVWDQGTAYEWDAGDMVIFSIRNTIPGGGNFDGGEIIVKPHTGLATFLTHGGRLWNTANPIAATFGVATEEVDAIEAYPGLQRETPTLTQWGLIILVVLIVASAIFIMVRRRKVTVPA